MTQISPMLALMLTITAMVDSSHATPLWVPDKRAEPEESKPAESKAEPKASETHKQEPKPTASSHEKASASKAEPKQTEKPKASSTHKEAHASATTKKASSTPNEKEKKADASSSSSHPFVSPIGIPQHETGASPTATTSFVDQSNSDNKEASGLSGGAVAGIVIAVLVGVAAIIGFILVRKKKKAAALNRSRMNPDPFTMGFGSHDPPPFNNNSNNYPPHTAYTANQSPMIQLPPIGASAQSPMMAPTMTHSPAINQYNSEVNHYNNGPSNAMQSMPSPEYNHAPSPVPAAPVVVPAPQESPQPVAAQASTSLGIFTVVSTYTPTLSDELDIQPGDRVDVIVEYDDGWCQGINLSRGNCKGVFPKHCVDFFGDTSQQQPQTDSNKLYDASNMKRVSSMLGQQQQKSSPYYL
ncbi:hypothetical protein BJV82DRAFT_659830 [Fennellomyces sp. T-0311]|nr:hypothetical protein BJV82DRAFT_659830 [Fennellomyces sp. T-0311]